MSNSKVTKNRKIGVLVAYTTLACSLVSLGVYVYRQQKKFSSPRGSDQNSRQSQDNGTLTDGRSTEVRSETDPWIPGCISSSIPRCQLLPKTITVGSTFVMSVFPCLPSYSVGHIFFSCLCDGSDL